MHCAGLDVGFENPMFACLESNYEECDQDPTGDALQQLQQTLTFYELDLGAKLIYVLLAPKSIQL